MLAGPQRVGERDGRAAALRQPQRLRAGRVDRRPAHALRFGQRPLGQHPRAPRQVVRRGSAASAASHSRQELDVERAAQAAHGRAPPAPAGRRWRPRPPPAAAPHRRLRPACGELAARRRQLQVDAGVAVDAGQAPGRVQQLDDAVERQHPVGPARGRAGRRRPRRRTSRGRPPRAAGGSPARRADRPPRSPSASAACHGHPAGRRDLRVHRVAQQRVAEVVAVRDRRGRHQQPGRDARSPAPVDRRPRRPARRAARGAPVRSPRPVTAAISTARRRGRIQPRQPFGGEIGEARRARRAATPRPRVRVCAARSVSSRSCHRAVTSSGSPRAGAAQHRRPGRVHRGGQQRGDVGVVPRAQRDAPRCCCGAAGPRPPRAAPGPPRCRGRWRPRAPRRGPRPASRSTRLGSSAQCRSSSTTTVGAVDSRSSTASNASRRAARPPGRPRRGRPSRAAARRAPRACRVRDCRPAPAATARAGERRRRGRCGPSARCAPVRRPRGRARRRGWSCRSPARRARARRRAARERGAQHLERRVPPDQLHARSLRHGAGNGTAPGGAGG